ncbi:Ultraviolet-B receptor uvr8 [Turnera subulata]|uniref:Ultraviolet-B receptor uvr8 n=1 Tax=Turnera subulata TaxID=218843 RepID=A0A9Q0FX52_9ROSI|nr:Ultraviolet-B receptor uvr8 [Turnera subulata]
MSRRFHTINTSKTSPTPLPSHHSLSTSLSFSLGLSLPRLNFFFFHKNYLKKEYQINKQPKMTEQEGGSSEVTGPFRRILLISAGASHSVALLSGNVICSWGRGEDGQLGHGDAEDRLSPTQLGTLDGHQIVSITCGADHTTAYSDSLLQVYSWGWGDFGRLGHGNSSDLFIPQPIKALQGVRIRQIACGDSHCLAVTLDGEVQSWGRNQNGQLGLGTTEDSLVPQRIQAFQGVRIKMVAAGAEHTAAVTESGELYGWGWGRYGNLGLGDRNDRLVPEKVSFTHGEKMVIVACGWRHTIAVSSAGGLYTYGWSKYGQLGHGDFEDHLTPYKLEALRDCFISQVRSLSLSLSSLHLELFHGFPYFKLNFGIWSLSESNSNLPIACLLFTISWRLCDCAGLLHLFILN